MAVLPLQTGKDNAILRAVSKPVATVTKDTLQFITKMEKTMLAENGVGIAAPQVGQNIRVILALLGGKRVTPMVNPEILSRSADSAWGEEGCLSLPGQWGQVERSREVTVKFLTPKGEERVMKLSDFDARIVQHEVDHLNGVLFTDYLESEDLMLLQMNQKQQESKRI